MLWSYLLATSCKAESYLIATVFRRLKYLCFTMIEAENTYLFGLAGFCAQFYSLAS